MIYKGKRKMKKEKQFQAEGNHSGSKKRKISFRCQHLKKKKRNLKKDPLGKKKKKKVIIQNDYEFIHTGKLALGYGKKNL